MTTIASQPARSLASELGCRSAPPHVVQRLVQAVVGSRPGGWICARVMRRVDHASQLVSGGRLLPSSLLAGLPIVELWTTGARTGRTRRAFVLAIPLGEDIAISGADFASSKSPAWVANLIAEPKATLALGNHRVEVVARLATDAEFQVIAESAVSVYPPSAGYVERIRNRPLRTFVLTRGQVRRAGAETGPPVNTPAGY